METDKANDDTNDFDLTFDDVDLGWAMKASNQALPNTAVGLSMESSAMNNAGNASGISTLISRSRPVVSQALHWPLRTQRSGAGCCARLRRH